METKRIIKAEISIFLILFLTGGFSITNDIISSIATIALWVITAGYLLFSLNSVDKNLVMCLILLVITMVICTIVNDENPKVMVSVAFSFVTAFLYSNIYDFETFKKSYINVMKTLCIISLIGFFAFLLIEPLNNLFVTYNLAGNRFSNLLIYTNSYNIVRNQGMFWEPGAFQTFVVIAFIFEITKTTPNIKAIVIFIVTIITTFSTTGYICMALVLFSIFLLRNKGNQNLKLPITVIVIAICLFIYFNQDILFSTNRSTTFGKIINFFKEESYNSTDSASSSSIRYFAIIKPLEAFFESPLFGWGYVGLIKRTALYTHSMNTCTFVNWFAVYGAIFGIIMLSGFIRLSRKIGKTALVSVLTLFILFISTISENYVNNATMVLLALYGHSNNCFQEDKGLQD